eukprot:3554596-Rhodomonas_salina.3
MVSCIGFRGVGRGGTRWAARPPAPMHAPSRPQLDRILAAAEGCQSRTLASRSSSTHARTEQGTRDAVLDTELELAASGPAEPCHGQQRRCGGQACAEHGSWPAALGLAAHVQARSRAHRHAFGEGDVHDGAGWLQQERVPLQGHGTLGLVFVDLLDAHASAILVAVVPREVQRPSDQHRQPALDVQRAATLSAMVGVELA